MGVVTPRGSNVNILTASASQMSGTSMWVVLELSSLGHSCQIGADMGECWLSLGYSFHPNFEVVTFSGLRTPRAAMADLEVPTRPTWTQF